MLAHEPKVWLLDEPTRGADGPAKAWLAGRLREHAAGGGAAIVATHDVESAAQYATRVIQLDAGTMAFDLPAGCGWCAASGWSGRGWPACCWRWPALAGPLRCRVGRWWPLP